MRYAVVGDGPELGALKELARSLGLSRVSFFGAVSEEERRALLARSRVFVMCPRQDPGDVEGLGLVYFEAFEYGLPVVAANSGGVPDAVGDAGILVADPEHPVQIAAAIRETLDERRYGELDERVRTRQRTLFVGAVSGRVRIFVRTGPRQARAGNLERVECVKQTTRHVTRSAGPIHSRSSSAIVRGDGACPRANGLNVQRRTEQPSRV